MCLAIPARILSWQGEDALLRMAKVSFSGIVREISLAYTPEAQIGDYVLVHAGFAIARLNEEEAQKTLDALEALGESLAEEFSS